MAVIVSGCSSAVDTGTDGRTGSDGEPMREVRLTTSDLPERGGWLALELVALEPLDLSFGARGSWHLSDNRPGSGAACHIASIGGANLLTGVASVETALESEVQRQATSQHAGVRVGPLDESVETSPAGGVRYERVSPGRMELATGEEVVVVFGHAPGHGEPDPEATFELLLESTAPLGVRELGRGEVGCIPGWEAFDSGEWVHTNAGTTVRDAAWSVQARGGGTFWVTLVSDLAYNAAVLHAGIELWSVRGGGQAEPPSGGGATVEHAVACSDGEGRWTLSVASLDGSERGSAFVHGVFLDRAGLVAQALGCDPGTTGGEQSTD